MGVSEQFGSFVLECGHAEIRKQCVFLKLVQWRLSSCKIQGGPNPHMDAILPFLCECRFGSLLQTPHMDAILRFCYNCMMHVRLLVMVCCTSGN